MLFNFNLKRCFAVALLTIMLSVISVAGVAEPWRRGGYIDSRYHHNRSYPARGESFRTIPRGYRTARWDHLRYYHHHGAWYRYYGGRYFVVAPPVGLFVPFLPSFYSTVWFHGTPYYYANETYYISTPGGYVVTQPPQGEISEAPPESSEAMENKLFIYPRKGQSQAQQDNDCYECHKWAKDQTNYDPTTAIPQGMSANQAMQRRADYQRAMAACIESRGYTVK